MRLSGNPSHLNSDEHKKKPNNDVFGVKIVIDIYLIK